MCGLQYRVFGLVLTAAFFAAAGTVAAQDAPDDDDVDVAEADEEVADEQEATEDADEEADSDADAEAEEEEEGDQVETRDDDWETPLRDPIPPILNTEGGMGFHGIASAVSPGPFTFQVGLMGQASGGSDVIRHNDQHRFLSGNVLVNASFLDYFGAHFSVQARNNLNSYGRPQAMLAQGDAIFGFTGRYPVSPGIWLGGDLSFYIPSNFEHVGVSLPSTTVRPRLLASFDVDEIMGAQADLYIPVVAHINMGYRIDNTESLLAEGTRIDRIERQAYGISAYDLFEMGVGAEFPLPYVTPFLGWTLGIPVNPTGDVCASDRALDCVSDVGGGAFPHKLSLGAKGEPVENLGLHLGIDLGLTGQQAEGLPATLPYNVNFGVSWNIDPLARERIVETEVEKEIEIEPVRGVLLGRLLDERSGEPVEGVRITYLERDVTSQVTAGETGLFQSYPFEPGEEVELEFHHPRYEVTQASWTVEEGSEELEFLMEPLPLEATVRGRIFAAVPEVEEGEEAEEIEDGEETEEEPQPQPLTDTLVVIRDAQGTVYETRTGPDGNFEQTVLAGAVSVAAVSDGHLTAGQFLELEPESEVDVEFTLNAVDELQAELTDSEISTSGRVHFESGQATILDRSETLLDHVAAVILANPDAGNIEIQGHTDDAGEEDELLELSQARADAVRDALVERGVSPKQIEAVGHGMTSPMMPNTSSRNRSMNRRIEFHLSD